MEIHLFPLKGHTCTHAACVVGTSAPQGTAAFTQALSDCPDELAWSIHGDRNFSRPASARRRATGQPGIVWWRISGPAWCRNFYRFLFWGGFGTRPKDYRKTWGDQPILTFLLEDLGFMANGQPAIHVWGGGCCFQILSCSKRIDLK